MHILLPHNFYTTLCTENVEPKLRPHGANIFKVTDDPPFCVAKRSNEIQALLLITNFKGVCTRHAVTPHGITGCIKFISHPFLETFFDAAKLISTLDVVSTLNVSPIAVALYYENQPYCLHLKVLFKLFRKRHYRS